jgi:hypothetical protein
VSYHCGTSALGRRWRRITCDGCGAVYRVRADRVPPSWFLDGKAPRGWIRVNGDEGQRRDYCGGCRGDVRR